MTKNLQTRWPNAGHIRAICAVFLSVSCAVPVRADSAPPIIAGVARNLPVLARNGMVVAQEKIAARVGLDVLKQGGNAVDAAVATGFALAVTLPRAGNLGGGGFMVVHLAKENRDVALDYREIAPAATTANVFLDAEGAAVPAKSRDSGLGVGVPGTVAGLAYAREKWGSGKLSLADLLAPAIRLAREGVPVEDDLADSLPQAARRLGEGGADPEGDVHAAAGGARRAPRGPRGQPERQSGAADSLLAS